MGLLIYMKNREIKFRAYDTELKFMVDDAMYIMGIGTGNVFFDNGVDLIEQSNKLVLMQCTGVKDKSCIDIYEGDIISMKDGNKGIVKFCHQRAGFYIEYQIPPLRANYSRDFNVTYGDGETYIDGTIQVIGNIY